MWWLIISGIFIASVFLMVLSLYSAELMHDDYDLKPEDIWPLDQRPMRLSDDDYNTLNEHLDNPPEANSKLKEAAKKYNS
jgi:hypothetical protein